MNKSKRVGDNIFYRPMAEPSFSTRLTTNLRTKLGENYQVVPEYEAEAGTLRDVHDLAIIEDGHLKMLFELEVGDSFDEAKQGLRKFYAEMGEVSDLVLAACSHEKLVIFDADTELVNETYKGDTAEKMAEEITNFLQR